MKLLKHGIIIALVIFNGITANANNNAEVFDMVKEKEFCKKNNNPKNQGYCSMIKVTEDNCNGIFLRTNNKQVYNECISKRGSIALNYKK